jgi:glycosyltransferase involved in cell wall biosynthesis
MNRIAADKGIEDALEIARRVKLPLRIAGAVHHADAAYFESRIRPMLSTPGVHFEGSLAQSARQDFLGGALALLAPLQSDEPLALGLIEALACGTPVIAYRRGVVPEIVDPGVSGQVVTDISGAVAAVERVAEMDRWRCRRAFEQRFLARRMATEYLSAYETLAAGEPLALARSPI